MRVTNTIISSSENSTEWRSYAWWTDKEASGDVGDDQARAGQGCMEHCRKIASILYCRMGYSIWNRQDICQL